MFDQIQEIPDKRIQNLVKHLKCTFFCKDDLQLKTVNFLHKKLHLRYLVGFLIHLCIGRRIIHRLADTKKHTPSKKCTAQHMLPLNYLNLRGLVKTLPNM